MNRLKIGLLVIVVLQMMTLSCSDDDNTKNISEIETI